METLPHLLIKRIKLENVGSQVIDLKMLFTEQELKDYQFDYDKIEFQIAESFLYAFVKVQKRVAHTPIGFQRK